MDQELSQVIKTKPGPKAKPKLDTEALLDRIDKLEQCLQHVATNSGQGNTLGLYGLKRWIPGKKDMGKYN